MVLNLRHSRWQADEMALNFCDSQSHSKWNKHPCNSFTISLWFPWNQATCWLHNSLTVCFLSVITIRKCCFRIGLKHNVHPISTTLLVARLYAVNAKTRNNEDLHHGNYCCVDCLSESNDALNFTRLRIAVLLLLNWLKIYRSQTYIQCSYRILLHLPVRRTICLKIISLLIDLPVFHQGSLRI